MFFNYPYTVFGAALARTHAPDTASLIRIDQARAAHGLPPLHPELVGAPVGAGGHQYVTENQPFQIVTDQSVNLPYATRPGGIVQGPHPVAALPRHLPANRVNIQGQCYQQVNGPFGPYLVRC